MFLEIEAGLSVLGLLLAFTIPNLGSRWFEVAERSFAKLASKRGLSVVVVGLTALALRLALLPIVSIPKPGCMDEFSYLLLSDTFAHGRLTNPSNPMWVHFETLHVIWQPTYTSKYWPAQGIVMALGQVLLGHPFWGVWLSIGLMCAAITWMLQPWVGDGWALLGGFLAVIRLGTFSYWANSYWGGAVAALGGALVLGALPRLKHEHRVRNALLIGLGFAILANSRPYEGLFFGIPIAVSLLVWLWKLRRPELGRVLKRAIVPLLAVLVLTVLAMGYYFWRTTGSPLEPPYFVYQHTYNPVPYFPWKSLKPIPVYRHAEFLHLYFKYFLASYEHSQSITRLIGMKLANTYCFLTFFLGPVFLFPFALVAAVLPVGFSWKNISPGTRFLLSVCGVTLAGELLPIWYIPHYSAPITSGILALVLIALRRVRVWKWHGISSGMFVTRSVTSICVLLLVLRAAAGPLHIRVPSAWPEAGIPTWCSPNPTNLSRAETLAKLRRFPGRQLVIVRYRPKHDIFFNEWVYNRADLNSAKVIWARDMGPEKNKELIDFFKERHAWLVDADDNPPELRPYSTAADRKSLIGAQEGP